MEIARDKEMELKKYALQCALSCPSAFKDQDPIDVAEDILEFLASSPGWASTSVEKEKAVVEIAAPVSVPEPYVRPFKLAPLTAIQKTALKTAIDLYRDTGRVTGSDVGRVMNYATPGALNLVFRKLMTMGYVRRKGWFITPVYTPDCVAVGPIIQKLPDGVAMGYRPMRAKLGEVGRIS